ncbi:hypothetical protein [Oceanobacillus neutriphilus]
MFIVSNDSYNEITEDTIVLAITSKIRNFYILL